MARSESKVFEALLFDGEGGARLVADEGVDQWQPGDGTLWIDLNLSNNAARKWLRANPFIDAGAADILLAAETRPRSLPARCSLNCRRLLTAEPRSPRLLKKLVRV